MGLKSKEIDHLLIRQLKLTAKKPVIAKSLGYGDSSHLKRNVTLKSVEAPYLSIQNSPSIKDSEPYIQSFLFHA